MIAAGLGRAPARWWRKAAPAAREARCFRNKSDVLNILREANWRGIEQWGGMDRAESPVEFEAVNHKYAGGRQQPARTLAEAFWLALPATRPPYCLDDVDLEALNDTDAGRMIGGFNLPDYYFEQRAAAEEEEFYRRAYGLGGPMERRRRQRSPVQLRCKRVTIGPRTIRVCNWHASAQLRAARFVARDGSGRTAIVHPSTKVRGRCQLTWFEHGAPTGDIQASTCNIALRELNHRKWKLVEWG